MRRFYILRNAICVTLLLGSKALIAQNVGINSTGNAPAASAGLDVSFTNKGLLIPNVTLLSTSDVTTIPSPATSLLVYNLGQTGGVTPGYYYYSGTAWMRLATSTSAWTLGGNSTTVTDFLGTTNNTSLRFRTNNAQTFYLDSLGNAAVGLTPAFSSSREKLLVDAGITNSYNVISGKGTINNYLQLNIQNKSAGITASSDIVATNDTGNETANFVDLGINSSGNTSTGVLGGASTGYLYSTGNDFSIGNSTSGKDLKFFTGGIAATNEKMRITSLGKVGVGITDPDNNLVIKDTMEIRRTGSNVSQLLFSNTASSGDFRIAGDGGDLFWQGGGARALQMGSYWTTVLTGDRQVSTFPSYISGSSLANIGVLVASQRDASIPMVVRGNSATQSANLTEWRTSANAVLGSFSAAGNLGLGVVPTTKLHVLGTNPVRFDGIQTGTSADSILTMQSGVIKKVAPAAIATSSSNAWALVGNSGATVANTSTTGAFIGTSDAQDLRFRTNNLQRMQITSGGNVGIGMNNSTAPTYKLQVASASNPLFLSGLQQGTTTTDSILSIAAGVVRNVGPFANTVWAKAGNASTTSSHFVGTTDAQPLRFRTNNLERMQITSGGNLGLGLNSATTPSYKLHVGAVSNPLFLSGVQNGASTDSTLTIISGVVKKLAPSWSSLGNTGTTAGTHFIGTTDDEALVFKTNNTEAVRIGSDGNVGIGVDPGTDGVLVIDGGTAPASQALINAEANMDDYIQFNIKNNNNGTNASTDIIATANNGSETAAYIDMGINSQGYATSTTKILNGANTAYVYANAGKMAIGNAAQSQPLIFFTNSTGSSGDDATGTERMRIQSDGEVYIGSTTDNGTYKLQVTGGSRLSGNTIAAMATGEEVIIGATTDNGDYKFQVNGDARISGTVYYTSQSQLSDRRLKTNIVNTNYGLNEIMNLQPVAYNWKTNPTEDKQIGLIAQDLRIVIPEAVKGNEAIENLSVDYIKLIPVLINAIKEQQKQIEELKTKVQNIQK